MTTSVSSFFTNDFSVCMNPPLETFYTGFSHVVSVVILD